MQIPAANPSTPDHSPPVGPRIVILGVHGATNAGDDAILAAMLAELRAAIPTARFAVLSHNPEALVAEHGVEPIFFADSALRAALTGADLLIIGGGGLIFDFRSIGTYGDFFSTQAHGFYPYYRTALIAHGRGIPIHLYALGIGPLVGGVARALTRTICDLASAITVRDSFSLLELERCGVPRAKVRVTADPVTRLVPPAVERQADRPQIGFVIRNWYPIHAPGPVQVPHSDERQARYLDLFAVAADHVVQRWGARPTFFAVQAQWDDDRDFAHQVRSRMAHASEVRIVADTATFQELQALIGGFDLVVSTRLHGLIFAASAGIPGIGINLNTKVRAFLCDLGVPELALSPWNGRAAALTETIDRVLQQLPAYRERLAAGMATQRAAAAGNPAISAALLSSHGR